MFIQTSRNLLAQLFVRGPACFLDKLLQVLGRTLALLFHVLCGLLLFYPRDASILYLFVPGRHSASGHRKINELSVADFP